MARQRGRHAPRLLAALVGGLLLVYEPPLLDILPLYILFMLASPWVLGLALRRGWTAVMAASSVLWVLAQFGLGEWIHGAAVALVGMRIPVVEVQRVAAEQLGARVHSRMDEAVPPMPIAVAQLSVRSQARPGRHRMQPAAAHR